MLLGLAACQALGGAISPTPTSALPTPSPTPEEWSHVEAEGVRLSLRTPAGWQSIANDYGILLAQHADFYAAGTSNDMLVYVFVPAMDKMEIGELNHDENIAWEVLNHVTKMPSLVGNSSVSRTVPVKIGDQDGAYYLLSDAAGNRVLVLAVKVPAADKLIICNISTSDEHVSRIREVLPMVFENLSVNGEPLEPLPLDWLPEPLEFPVYETSGIDDS